MLDDERRELWSHPEAEENRRMGAEVFCNVWSDYVIEDEMLCASGTVVAKYAPFVHAELPGEVAKLRAGDHEAVLRFARSYGGFDYPDFPTARYKQFRIAAELEKRVQKYPRRFKGKYRWPFFPRADPMPWIRAHASGVYACLALTEELNARRVQPDRVRKLLLDLQAQPHASGSYVFDVTPLFAPRAAVTESPIEAAMKLRADIVNANLGFIYRYVSTDEKGKAHSYFGFRGRIAVTYWHLANLIDGGTVKRCEADGCGGIFIQTDPRQRFCPKRWREAESACALRQRQKRHREEQHGATPTTREDLVDQVLPKRRAPRRKRAQ